MAEEYTRDLSAYQGKELESYKKLYAETKKLFSEKVEKVTVIHAMIIDRFVSTYLDLLSLDSIKSVNEKKYKTAQEKFQGWAKTVMDTLHSSAMETESRRAFFTKVKDILIEEVPDEKLRKRMFKRILEEAIGK